MLSKIIIVVIANCLFHGYHTAAYNLTVETRNGYVRGYEETSKADQTVKYFAFKGVPYGQPPVGSLRFKDPQPVRSWEGVFNATSFAQNCAKLETSQEGNPVIGSEDCLYLNIYIPKTQQHNKDLSLPVLVWYHGGGFTRGGSETNPSYFMEKPVIVVAVSYRLGVLGFLSTLDKNARGNAGLKDQSLALRWLQENIKYFGGDTSRVTIIGQSAGGASVEYQLVSPKSAGLFSQAICESGSTLNEWGFRKDPLEHTLKLAKRLNITSNNTEEVVAALQQIDYVTLLKNGQVDGKFLPSLESESKDAFVSESTYNMWSSGNFNKVPVLRGYTSEEGSYGKNGAGKYAKDPKALIPAGLNMDSDDPLADEVVEAITAQYFPGYSYDSFTNSINFMTQHYFVRGIRKTVADQVKTGKPLYFYRFTYVTKENYTKGANGGPGHSEEGLYTWYSKKLLNDEDILMKNRIITMWTNFATYGNPTPEEDLILGNVIWAEATEGVTGDDIRFLDIGYDLVPGINPDHEDFLFWRKIFARYAKPTICTY